MEKEDNLLAGNNISPEGQVKSIVVCLLLSLTLKDSIA